VLHWSRYVCEKKLVKFIISEFVRVKGRGGTEIRGLFFVRRRLVEA
jgi:hypothetical protein